MRERLLKARDAIDPLQHASAAHAIGTALVEALARFAPAVLAAFWPVRREPALPDAWRALHDRGWTLALPVVVARSAPLVFRRWDGAPPAARDLVGIASPPENAEPLTPDVIVLPCLGFSRTGHRLGYGGGYYDRTLAASARRPVLIGIAFDQQECVFAEAPHDLQLDLLVTERGVRRFR